MPSRIITRQEIAKELINWHTGKLSSAQIQIWAESLYLNDDVDYEDCEGEQDNSVSNEILSALDMLDMNLALPEDAPIYLEFLQTPVGCFQIGFKRWQEMLQQINYASRRVQLISNPLYSPFLKS